MFATFSSTDSLLYPHPPPFPLYPSRNFSPWAHIHPFENELISTLLKISSYPPFWKWAQHHFQTESWIPRISWNMVALKPESEYTYIHLIIFNQILDVTLKNSFWNAWSPDLVSYIHLWWPCLWSNSHSQCTSLDPSGFSPQCWAGTCLVTC